MFSTFFKSKLQNVKNSVKLFSSDKLESDKGKCEVNLNAGIELLDHFQQQWSELSELNVQNAGQADKLAKQINNIYTKTNNDLKNVCTITQLLSSTPGIVSTVEKCTKQLIELGGSFGTVECLLFKLEDLIETLELQEKQLEHRFQLALYKEQKLVALEVERRNLAEKHAKFLSEIEKVKKKKLLERQSVCQAEFQNDLKAFRETGQLPKTRAPEPTTKLEEINLECDTEELDSFLQQ